MMLMSQSFSTYALVQCVVSAAQFTSGEISFYDAYAELIATDGEGNSTSPLRVEYDALTHFRIVRAQGLMRLTLPRTVVRRWAVQNAFETQLDDYEGDQTNVHDGSGAKADAIASSMTTVLLLQLGAEDMSSFLQSIAPLISASRRTRSASRISVTEPLPVYGVPLVDPAGSVRTEAIPSSSAMSTASVSSQEATVETDRRSHRDGALPLSNRRHRRSRRGERDMVHRAPYFTAEAAEQGSGRASAKEPKARRTAGDASDVALGAPHRAPELLGGDCGDSALVVAEAEAHSGVARSISGSSMATTSSEEDGGGTTSRSVRVAGAPAVTAADTGAAVQADRWPPLSKHQQSQQADLSQFANTLESVTEQLVGLLEETEEPGNWCGGRREPLHRRRLTVASASTVLRGAGQKQESRSSHRQPLPIITSTAAPSVCPSLKSTISEAGVRWHLQLQQSQSAPDAKTQYEPNVMHTADAEGGDPGGWSHGFAECPARMTADVQGRCATRVVRSSGGGGAYLCASELSSTATTELSRLVRNGACDNSAAPQKGPGIQSSTSEKEHDDVKKAATAAGVAVCDATGVWRAIGDVGVSETHSTSLHAGAIIHAFADTGDGDCGGGDCIASAVKSTRVSSLSSSAATSVKLGDMLVVPSAARNLGSASTAITAPPRRTVQFRSDSTAAVSVKALQPYPRNSGVADVAAYLRELFPVEDIVPKSTLQRRKRRSTAAASATKGLPASQRRGRAPARRAVKSTASVTSGSAPAIVPPCAPRKPSAGVIESQLPVKAALSPPPSPPVVRVSSNGGTAAAKRAPAQSCGRSEPLEAAGRARKRVKTDTAAAVRLSHNCLDAAPDTENNTGANTCSGTAEHGSVVRLTKPPQSVAYSVVRDACALGLVQAPVPPHGAVLATKPDTVATAPVAAAEDEAAAYPAVGEGAAPAALSSDAAKVDAKGLIRDPGAGADNREGPHGAVHRPLSQLSQVQLVTHEVTPSAGCVGGSLRYPLAEGTSRHPDENSDRASVGSSQATCPLLYCRDSRKERSRRVLRHMNIISQNIAAVHEAHDALRGLLLLMMEDGQL
ncbi:hypothetical protein JKF63_04445 [Porcisia hertigi]|uniref:Uncharacterized protein n=1 Tax=Porcisia hertigi TaxID=2761500 RepID=A0A836LI22_9TRYP|nr:hypothetical protein JKF63_04445 [Porcisia hertigi]